MKNKILIAILIIVIVIISGAFYYTNFYWPVKTFYNSSMNIVTSTSSSIAIANPASVNCKNKGGNLIINKKEDGSEYGLCYFDDARACEEWAMLRGDCIIPAKTTGYDTIDQKFCAWSGGKTLAVNNSICTFTNGKTCPTIDFYKGVCKRDIE